MKKKTLALILAASTMLTLGGATAVYADDYDDYAAAFNALTAGGGVDADFNVVLSMDGSEVTPSGNLKMNVASGTMYYEMQIGDNTVIQFTDGANLYTQIGDKKIKTGLAADAEADKNSNKAGEKEPEEGAPEGERSTFSAENYLSEFASFLEVSKIKNMGLLDPIASTVVNSTSKDGDVYTLELADEVVETLVNVMIESEMENTDGDSLSIGDVKDFTYKATVSEGVVTAVDFSGSVAVTVPGSLLDGEDATYDLVFDIPITFNNAGGDVAVELPDTADFN